MLSTIAMRLDPMKNLFATFSCLKTIAGEVTVVNERCTPLSLSLSGEPSRMRCHKSNEVPETG